MNLIFLMFLVVILVPELSRKLRETPGKNSHQVSSKSKRSCTSYEPKTKNIELNNVFRFVFRFVLFSVVMGVVLEQVEAVAKPLLVPVVKHTNTRTTQTTPRTTENTKRTIT